MGVLYADRGFISVNGVEVLDVESITINVNDGTKVVPTMTSNRRGKGFVKGNRDITTTFAVAVQNALGTPKLESMDFDNNDVALTFAQGADRYSLIGLNFVSMDQGASGVGTEGKKNFNLVALDIIDQVGNSSLFPTSISNSSD